MTFKMKFTAQISHQGEMLLVVIPKRLHHKARKKADSKEHVIITLEDF